MKKLLMSFLIGGMLTGGVFSTVSAGETRGPLLPEKTLSASKDCKYGTKRLFTLKHSARFIPNNLGTACNVQNHTVDVKNIASGVGVVFKSKTTSKDGFTAYGKAYTTYKGKYCEARTTLNY